jgi:hypothetical protein
MSLLFAFATYLQYNDPDPIQWMAIYGAATLLSAWAALRPAGYPWYAPAAVAAVALAWAGSIAPRALGKIAPSEMFKRGEMEDEVVEENRDMFGLLIVALWMLALVLARLRAGR